MEPIPRSKIITITRRRAQVVVVLGAVAALSVVAACAGPPAAGHGDSGNPGAGASVSSQAGPDGSPLVAFSGCVRSHGVPNFPDPAAGASNAKFPGPQQLGVSSALLGTAERACQHLLPAGVDDQFPAAEVPVLLRAMLPFSQCMRSQGVRNFPDPAVDSEGRPIFPLSTAGISLSYSHSQQFNSVLNRCQHLLPQQLGGIPFG